MTVIENKRRTTAADHDIGARVRMLRLQKGMSQTALGDALGLTFQQVQKYEKGANRVGAGRLHELSKVLGVPVTYFYEGVDAVMESPKVPEWHDLVNTDGAMRLLRAYKKMLPSARQHLRAVAEAMAGGKAED